MYKWDVFFKWDIFTKGDKVNLVIIIKYSIFRYQICPIVIENTVFIFYICRRTKQNICIGYFGNLEYFLREMRCVLKKKWKRSFRPDDKLRLKNC